MGNFICEFCGAEIIHDEKNYGSYCSHYPREIMETECSPFTKWMAPLIDKDQDHYDDEYLGMGEDAGD